MLARVFSLVLTKIIVELALEFDAIGLNKRFGKQCRQRNSPAGRDYARVRNYRFNKNLVHSVESVTPYHAASYRKFRESLLNQPTRE